MTEALLYLVPALLLLATLALGRYPGERLRLALRGARALVARPRPAAPPRRPLSLVPLPRGGGLLATSRAGRAPPIHASRALGRVPV